MSATSARSNPDTPSASDGRLEFRVRLPAIAIAEEPLAPSADGTSETTRGMQVLNGILDKRSRGGSRRITGRRVKNRLWLLAMALVGLSCFALIFGLTKDGATMVEPDNTDVFADDESDDFESGSGARSVAAQVQRSRVASELNTATAGELPHDSNVQAAVYQTSRPINARTVWLDGTIDPEDSHVP